MPNVRHTWTDSQIVEPLALQVLVMSGKKSKSSSTIDFSDFVRVDRNGSIWWPLLDAIRLGAGYLPSFGYRDSLAPELRAPNDRVLANEAKLLSAFSPSHHSSYQLRWIERNGERFVEAPEFLDWLKGYVGADPASGIGFPEALARAVNSATAEARQMSARNQPFQGLERSLEGRFQVSIAELEPPLRGRVVREFFPFRWEDLAEEQRRSVARQYDARNDPAFESDRQFWWDLGLRGDSLRREFTAMSALPANTVAEHVAKASYLEALAKQLSAMKRQERSDDAREKRHPKERQVAHNAAGRSYMAYPKAASLLASRLNATAAEIAAWIVMGPKLGGLAAYRNASELDPPPSFHFSLGVGNERDFNYMAQMVRAWFAEDDLEAFEPSERFIDGRELVARWTKALGEHAEDYVIAKIAESRLDDLHPITGGTQASSPGNDAYPPLQMGLFSMRQISAIEDNDFAEDSAKNESVSPGSAESVLSASALEVRTNFPVFRDPEKNETWWKKTMRNAVDNGLVRSRVGAGKRGQGGGSLWNPKSVAGWLLGRDQRSRGTLTPAGVQAGLRKFPGCEEIADGLVLPDE